MSNSDAIQSHVNSSPAPIFFMHIPKTGGITFNTLLASRFRARDIYPVPLPAQVLYSNFPIQVLPVFKTIDQTFDPDQVKSFKLVMGHWDYTVVRRFPQMRLMTMLRDPLARLLSWYKHVKRHKDGWTREDHAFVMQHHLGVGDFYRLRNHAHRQTNQQARYLTGHVWTEPDALPPNDELLAMAKENLSRFTYVGITESFLASVWLLDYTFGWSPTEEIPHLNTASEPTDTLEISASDREFLESISQVDMPLYVYAVDLFRKRCGTMIETLISKSACNVKVPLPPEISVVQPQPLQEAETLFFMPIPHTQADAFVQGIRSAIPSDLEYQHTGTLHRGRLKQAKFITGSFDYALVQQCAWLIPVTLLQHPTSYILDHYAAAQKRNANLTLEAYLQQDEVQHTLRNGQSRYLAGLVYDRSEMVLADDALLALVRYHLKSFRFVGLEERLTQSVWLFRYQMDFCHFDFSGVEAPSLRHTMKLSQAQVEQIKEITRVDQAIYEEAEAQFNQQFAAMMQTLLWQHHSAQNEV